MRSSWFTHVGHKSNGKCPYKKEGTDRRGGGLLNTKAEIGVMKLQVKECMEPPRTQKRQGKILPKILQRESGPANTLILVFQPPELWKNKFLFFYATKFAVIYCSSPRKLIQDIKRKLVFLTHGHPFSFPAATTVAVPCVSSFQRYSSRAPQ